MTVEILLTLGVLGSCLGTLLFTRIAPDAVLLAGLVVLMTTGVLGPADALVGFSNEGMLTVAVMYVLAAGLRETGAIEGVVGKLFKDTQSLPAVQLRMMLPVSAISAFVNNTPVVASFIPAVSDWARKRRISPSKLMLPLSYAAIFGGSCTLIGTSTNLIVHGMLLTTPGARGFDFFELAWVGIPCAIIGFIYVLLFSPKLLRVRIPPLQILENAREYTVEMRVEAGSPLVGKTVEAAGLRHLPGLFLIEINRGRNVIPAVSPAEVLEADDHLVFAGITDSVIDLQKIRGLTPATDQLFKLDQPRPNRRFIEAVIARRSPVVGRTIREGQFRSRYGAVIIAVARGGRRIRSKIGDIVLEGGDTLLLETDEPFMQQHRNSRDFLLLRMVSGAAAPRHEHTVTAWAILFGVVVIGATGILSVLNAVLIGAGLMLATRCCSISVARNSIDLQVLVVIASALGIGRAMQLTGAGEILASPFMEFAGQHPVLMLAVLFAVTSMLTEVISNNSAAALMFPIVLATSVDFGIDIMPLAVTVTIAASASFSTPIGYQTNLMVMGPGGYRFSDYTRFGLPLNVLFGLTTVLIVPWVWPLTPA
ncbi:MAG: SLC13 family permease [Proteobacteria bacterium]|nr:SLC13 family permease [Pseudomonadota bacterium]